MILLSIASDSGSTGILPSITRTLPQAELLHKALVSRACKDGQVPPEELTGRSMDRTPLAGHGHTHVIPLDLDLDGHLDHVLLWAKMGFSPPIDLLRPPEGATMIEVRDVKRTSESSDSTRDCLAREIVHFLGKPS